MLLGTSAAVLLGTFVQSFAFMALSYYQPLYFQSLGATPLMSGVRLMPFSVSTFPPLGSIPRQLSDLFLSPFRQVGSSIVSIAAGFYVAKVRRKKPTFRVMETGPLMLLPIVRLSDSKVQTHHARLVRHHDARFRLVGDVGREIKHVRFSGLCTLLAQADVGPS